MIVSDKEKLFVEQDLALYPTLVFSAKESLYKAIYPLCKQYFGFLEASLVDVKSNTFKLFLHSNQAQVAPFNDEYQGYFEVFDQTLISWITIK
jgi:enterobactin synthetase component D